MPINILMPALSPTMTEGNLAKWHKKEGDKIAPGDVIAEIETDKATMEVEAVDEGTIGKILVQEGAQGVAVNAPIAVLLEEGENSSVILSKTTDSKQPAPANVSKESSSVAALPRNDKVADTVSAAKTGSRVFASPLARRIAAEKGIDLAALSGSGPHGRIVREDVENYRGGGVSSTTIQKSVSRPPALPQSVPSDGAAYTAIPNNNIRKIAAKRLLESKQSVPHFYLTVDFRIDGLLAARQRINEQANGAFKLSVNDFIVKACAQALMAYPAANVSWTDEAILQYHNADVSVAVATPNGLMTPIIRHAQTKGLRQIADEVKELAARARENKLRPEEFQGGTFTVSNLGMYGIREFGAIINPPQACILAVGAGEQRPYAEDGQAKIGTFMTCTLSVDHRAVDGAVGAEYLQVLKGYIENPVSMLV